MDPSAESKKSLQDFQAKLLWAIMHVSCLTCWLLFHNALPITYNLPSIIVLLVYLLISGCGEKQSVLERENKWMLSVYNSLLLDLQAGHKMHTIVAGAPGSNRLGMIGSKGDG